MRLGNRTVPWSILERLGEVCWVEDDICLPSGAGLAYCRHLSTVRTHLSALVNHMIVSPDLPCDAGQGLTASIWEQYIQDSTVSRAGRVLCTRGQSGGRPSCQASLTGTQVDRSI